MLKTLYRVYLAIEKVDLVLGDREKVGERLECATFATAEEAQDFCTELSQRHCPCVTGENEILEEMTALEEYTAGD